MLCHAYPSLNDRALVRQETQIEMAGSLPVQCKAIHTFGGVRRQEVFKEEIYICRSTLVQRKTKYRSKTHAIRPLNHAYIFREP